MSRYYTANAEADIDRYVSDVSRREHTFPVCMWCGEVIYPYEVDAERPNLCPDCIRDIERGEEDEFMP